MNENANDAPKPESADAPTQDSSEAPAGDPTPPEAPGLGDFRYPDSPDVPSWMRGRTAEEVMSVSQDMYQTLQRGDYAPGASSDAGSSNFNTSSPQASQMNPTPPASPDGDVDPNLMYTDPAAYTRALRDSIRREMRSELQTAAGTLTTPLASMAKHQAMQNPKRKMVWEKYGPEIETIVARLPEHARARPEIWDEAARMVAGEHVDEIAQARAEEIIRRGSDAGMLPTQGGPPSPTSDGKGSPLAKLFESRDPAVKGFLDDGISLTKVREHYRKRGYAKDEDIVELLTRKKKAVR